jgi:hypothetical protein
MQEWVCTREYWMIFGGPGFLAVGLIWLLSYPLFPFSKLSLFLNLPCVSPVDLTDGRGERVGEEPNHTTGEKAWSYKTPSILSVRILSICT